MKSIKKYIDREEWNGTSVLVKGSDIITAGNTVYSMQTKDKNDEYQKIAEKYDVHFIFEDNIPQIDFYTIPYIDIMATDSLGGYIGTIGEISDFESEAPICYISKEKQCYMVADNFKAFMQHLDSWKNQMTIEESVIFYKTKSEAKSANIFLDLAAFEASADFHKKYEALYDHIVTVTMKDGCTIEGCYCDEFFEEASILISCMGNDVKVIKIADIDKMELSENIIL